MKIHYTNQGTLQNFRNFAETLDFSNPETLEFSMDENGRMLIQRNWHLLRH